MVAGGQRHETRTIPEAAYIRSASVRMPAQTDIVATETPTPILYVMTNSTFDEAIG